MTKLTHYRCREQAARRLALAKGWWRRHENAIGHTIGFAALAFLGAIVMGWLGP